jgi:cell shape-determining protein MreC|tara:strand:+ start:123 stop:338 length:216 start_codon:yes stop_codon:yes gene_type:complete
MKESTLIEMQKKIDSLTRVVQGVINEINNIKDFSIGTIETMKLMPDYDEAIEKLKEKLAKDSKKEETKLDI